ncbi:MAG: response regulator [Deltaproteobacteria bacterium]|nr:response regulator [Deltaproteobacteria bacterium]
MSAESVLVVDDDPAVRRQLAAMLEGQGFRVAEAEDAASALRQTKAVAPVGAVLDVMLPGPDGVALLSWLKAVDPELAVVMLTGQTDLKTAITCLTKGADGFLVKPVQESELLAVLRRALDRRRLVLDNQVHQRELERLVEERTGELRRATERLRELDQLKSEFVSRVSHELRSPLTVMHTNLAVMLERMVGPLTEGQEELLRSCQDNIDRLSRMVDNVLDLARIESGRMELLAAPLDPRHLVEAVVGYFAPTARERGIHLTAEAGVAKSGTVWADGDKIHQVLMNLVDNALKFTPSDGLVRVSVDVLDEAVRFTVSDTGVGVAAQDRERIFEPFTQGRPPVGGKRRGAGLGLSIARTLVDLHGGSVEVSSEDGKGSIFVFVIPRDCRTSA